MSFTCPVCGAVSHNENDAKEGYCGRCHRYTGTVAEGLWVVCSKCGVQGKVGLDNEYRQTTLWGGTGLVCEGCYGELVSDALHRRPR